jgi:phosphoribosyl 1,2-cyclic phosphodiesterase
MNTPITSEGLPLAVKHKIPVFANSDTAHAILETLDEFPKFKIFSTGETFEFGDLEIHPFSIQHDTLDPVAFTIKRPITNSGSAPILALRQRLSKIISKAATISISKPTTSLRWCTPPRAP